MSQRMLLLLGCLLFLAAGVMAAVYWFDTRGENRCVAYVRDVLQIPYTPDGDNAAYWQAMNACQAEK